MILTQLPLSFSLSLVLSFFRVRSQLLLYLATAPEEKIKYVEGGERAVAAFDAGVAGYEARAFRGMGVFVSTPVSLTLCASRV